MNVKIEDHTISLDSFKFDKYDFMYISLLFYDLI